MVSSLAEDQGQYPLEGNLLPIRSRLITYSFPTFRSCIECPLFRNQRIMSPLVAFHGDLRQRTKCLAHLRVARGRSNLPLNPSAIYALNRIPVRLEQTPVSNGRTNEKCLPQESNSCSGRIRTTKWTSEPFCSGVRRSSGPRTLSAQKGFLTGRSARRSNSKGSNQLSLAATPDAWANQPWLGATLHAHTLDCR